MISGVPSSSTILELHRFEKVQSPLVLQLTRKIIQTITSAATKTQLTEMQIMKSALKLLFLLKETYAIKSRLVQRLHCHNNSAWQSMSQLRLNGDNLKDFYFIMSFPWEQLPNLCRHMGHYSIIIKKKRKRRGGRNWILGNSDEEGRFQAEVPSLCQWTVRDPEALLPCCVRSLTSHFTEGKRKLIPTAAGAKSNSSNSQRRNWEWAFTLSTNGAFKQSLSAAQKSPAHCSKTRCRFQWLHNQRPWPVHKAFFVSYL